MTVWLWCTNGKDDCCDAVETMRVELIVEGKVDSQVHANRAPCHWKKTCLVFALCWPIDGYVDVKLTWLDTVKSAQWPEAWFNRHYGEGIGRLRCLSESFDLHSFVMPFAWQHTPNFWSLISPLLNKWFVPLQDSRSLLEQAQSNNSAVYCRK